MLQNLQEYGSITDIMSLLKPIHKTSIPYEQLFIQTFHHNGNLIIEQGTGEQNPLFQLAIDTMLTSATTLKQKQINTPPTTHSNQFQIFRDIATDNNMGMYIIHYSIEHIAFSTEYTLSTIVILI
jgi:hypothetical protein